MKGDSMGRKAEVAMYRIYATEKSHRYVRIVKSGRGWAPKTEPVGIPGSFYLRYAKNGRRTLESVGEDLQSALQEQKNRSQALSSPPSLVSLELGLRLERLLEVFGVDTRLGPLRTGLCRSLRPVHLDELPLIVHEGWEASKGKPCCS
jgi:hypothetical protein